MEFAKTFKIAKEVILAKIFKHKIPLRVKLNITFRCNLGCPFCLLRKELNKANNFEMDTLQIKRMMNEFKEMGTRFWVFSGGEPLLREDLGELINYAKERMDFHCSIATNGILLAETIKNNPSFRQLDLVQISLDGPREIQDKLRGAGTYDKIILALDNLRVFQIKTVIMVLISRYNLDSLDFLIKLAGQYNSGIVFQAIGTEPAAGAKLGEDFFPKRDTFKKVVEDLIKQKRENPLIISSLVYLRMLRDFWPDIPHRIKCYAGQFECNITPEGYVRPCCAKSNLTNLTDYCNEGLKGRAKNAFLRLDDMSQCRDCYYAGAQEANIIWGMVPLKAITLYNDYFCKKII